MLVSVVQPAGSLALAAMVPGSVLPYWSWGLGAWRAAFDPAGCLLPMAAPAEAVAGSSSPPLGGLAIATIPNSMVQQDTLLLLYEIDPATGNPVRILDTDVLYPGA